MAQVSAPAALTSSQNATAAASDPTTTQALANALQASYNQLQADVATLRTEVAALVTATNANTTDLASVGAGQGQSGIVSTPTYHQQDASGGDPLGGGTPDA